MTTAVHPPNTPAILQGAYAADLAVDGTGRVLVVWAGSDWAEEDLFASDPGNGAERWSLRPGVADDALLSRLGQTRYRLYVSDVRAGAPTGERLLAESHTVFQDPSIAAGDGTVLVAWGEKRDGAFEVRAWTGNGVQTVSAGRASLTRPSAAIDRDGRGWIAWQAFGDARCEILVARQAGRGWTAPQRVSVPADSAWRPALAAHPDGGVLLAWDAWLGRHFHVFVRTIDADGHAGDVQRLSDVPALAMDADLAVDDEGNAWVAWESSPAWGVDHRFNVEKAITLAGIEPSGRRFRPQSRHSNGQAPIDIESFTYLIKPEYIVPLAPRLVAGPQGVEVFFRRFRSRHHKDFGWTVERTVYAGSDWSDPERVSEFEGMPDTRYGIVVLPDASRLIAHNATEYAPRMTVEEARTGRTSDRPSRPVARERIEIVRAAPPPAAERPVRIQLRPYEGGDMDYPRVSRDGRTVTVDGTELILQWGDMHRHSHLSKCMSANDGTPIENFRWAVDHNSMDWWALTDHLEQLSHNEWRRVEETVSAFTHDGVFEPLFAYEWGGNPGHTNMFYADQELGDELRALTLMSGSLEELMERWDARIPPGAVLAARHFQGHHQAEVVEGFRPEWERVMEIMQTRGDQRAWIETYFLQRGAKVGFVGATDHARHHHFAYCITGVWAPDRTRASIFQALKDRRTFAASAKILMHTDVNGIAMGQEGQIEGQASLHVLAESQTPIRTIDVFRNGDLVHSEQVDATRVEWTWRDGTTPRDETYYYARVKALPATGLSSPAIAYASPIWVRRSDSA